MQVCKVCTYLNLRFLRRRCVVDALGATVFTIRLRHLDVPIIPLVASALETLHLPRLHSAQILLTHMDLTRLVTHAIGIDVLLGPRLRALWFLQRRLHHIRVCKLLSSEPEVDTRAHFFDLDARQFLARALRADEVEAQFDFWARHRVGGFLRADADEVLQALNVDLLGVLALEEVDEQALCERVFGLVGVFKDGTVEGHEGLQADGGLLVFELLECPEGVGVDVELEHVEELVREGACERHAVRALLRVQGEHEEGGVVLEGEELEGYGLLGLSGWYSIGCRNRRTGSIVERVDVVLLGEPLAEGSLQCAQVGNGKLEDLRGPLAGDEEGRLRVLVLLRLALRHCALCAGILGFSEVVSAFVSFDLVASSMRTLS
jgi:hypothetical protein